MRRKAVTLPKSADVLSPAPDGRLSFPEAEFLAACVAFLIVGLAIGRLLLAAGLVP